MFIEQFLSTVVQSLRFGIKQNSIHLLSQVRPRTGYLTSPNLTSAGVKCGDSVVPTYSRQDAVIVLQAVNATLQQCRAALGSP